ncbi:probable N-acetyltransferase CML2 [Lingula anatina]|uniref:Probable N-acetyltransferase CML2 n=1 Tax=Lingula anatina TaxID=7574 RepID=A0A1S3JUH2_LINAN|nr:probable N-acetyltransferase CML2 [Lingula anatina]|eukprot:XP_013414020.1 probable N-acetyltransferase CML2 [Lingula anatina]
MNIKINTTWDDGVIIGGVGIQKQQKSTAGKSGERRTTVAELKRMAVDPEYRRMGVAKALLDTAIEFAKQQGYDVIILDTSEIQQEAMRFYLKCGFEEIGVTRLLFSSSVLSDTITRSQHKGDLLDPIPRD